MSAQSLIAECLNAGVTIHLHDGAIRLRGAPDSVKAMSVKLRPHKAELLVHLTTAANDSAEIWGPFTPYCCPISPELVHELHRLIAQYAALYRLADAATARIIDAAKRQPAATVPESIAFFKKSIKEHNNQTKGFTS